MSQHSPYTEVLDISGINKSDLLCALFKAAVEAAPFSLELALLPAPEISPDYARELIDRAQSDHEGRRIEFDHIDTLFMKIDITGDTFDPYAYDQNNGGPGTAERVVAHLRAQR